MFLLRLAAMHGMTAEELSHRMSSREFAEWQAVDRYFHPLPDPWLQTASIIVAILAKAGVKNLPTAAEFVPTVGKPPQHQLQIDEQLRRMEADLNG